MRSHFFDFFLKLRIKMMAMKLNVVENNIDHSKLLNNDLIDILQSLRTEVSTSTVLRGDDLAVRLTGMNAMLKESSLLIQESKNQSQKLSNDLLNKNENTLSER